MMSHASKKKEGAENAFNASWRASCRAVLIERILKSGVKAGWIYYCMESNLL